MNLFKKRIGLVLRAVLVSTALITDVGGATAGPTPKPTASFLLARRL
jgi:hypothetical protein